MSLQFNTLMLAGNLSRDPVHKLLGKDKNGRDRAVCQFGVATNRRFRDARGEMQERVTFVECEAWGTVADFVSGHFAKGDAIMVGGRLEVHEYEKDGVKRQYPKCIVSDAHFVVNKSAAPSASDNAAGGEA